MEISVTEFNTKTGKNEPTTVELELPTLTSNEVEFFKEQERIAASCKNHETNVKFYDDNEHPLCSKHCYTCTACGGIIQIG